MAWVKRYLQSACDHITGVAIGYDSWIIHESSGIYHSTDNAETMFDYCPNCGKRLGGTASSHGNSETDGKQEGGVE